MATTNQITPTTTPAPVATAPKATLINDAGVKKVVTSGSQEAQGLFGQGYKLMGATVSPPVGGNGVSTNAPTKTSSDLMTDTTLPDQLAEAKQKNFELYQKQLSDAATTAQNDTYSKSIQALADQVKSNLTQTFTAEQQARNSQDLLAKQNEIRKLNNDVRTLEDTTDKAVSDVDFNNNLLTSQGNLSKAQIEREATFKSRAMSRQLEAMSADEANLISMVNLSRQEKSDLISGTKSLIDFQDKIQSHIDSAKQEVITAAKDLTTQQQTQLATAIEAYKGIDPDKLTADQTASLSKVIMDAGLDPSIVFAGMRATNAQKTLDNAAKTKQIIGSESTGYYEYDSTTGKKTQILAPVVKKPTVSEQIDAAQAGLNISSDGTVTDPSKGIIAGFDINKYATDPNHETAVASLIQGMGQMTDISQVQSYINKVAPNSPITADMISKTSEKYGVPWEMLLAMMQQDSSLGTEGKGARTFNPGNVGNTDSGATKNYGSWQAGVNAVGDWLNKHRATASTNNSTAYETAKSIFDGSSTLKISDLPTKDREAVNKELVKLKNDALKSGNIDGVIRASAGGSAPSDAFKQSFEKGINVIAQISDLKDSISKGSTGPIEGILRSNNPYDTKAQLIKAQLNALVPNLARGVYGEVGVLTDQDIAQYTKTLPNLTSTDDVNQLVLGMTVRAVQRGLETKLKVQAGSGTDVSGLADIYNTVKGQADQLLGTGSSSNANIQNAAGDMSKYDGGSDFSKYE